MLCTWKDCNQYASSPQKDRNGKVWANLCIDHNKEIEGVLASPQPQSIMRVWVLATGGAKKMA